MWVPWFREGATLSRHNSHSTDATPALELTIGKAQYSIEGKSWET